MADKVTLYVYQFSKRENSTSIPHIEELGDSWSEVPLFAYKSQQDDFVTTPVVTTRGDYTREPWGTKWNYASITTNGETRYYYIDKSTFVTQYEIEMQLRLDYLATYREYIKNTRCFVLRSQSDFNVMLPDDRVSVESGLWNEKSNRSSPFVMFDQEGCFILSTVSIIPSTSGTGFTTTYILNDMQVTQLATALCNLDDNALNWLNLSFTGASSAVCGCRWIPIAPDNLAYISEGASTSVQPVYLGKYQTELLAYTLGKGYTTGIFTIDVPWIKDNDEFNFLSIEPYSEAYLYLPCVGNVKISLSSIYPDNTLTVAFGVDFISGAITYNVHKGEPTDIGTKIGSFKGSFGCDVPLPSNTSGLSPQGLVSAITGATSGVVSSGAMLGMKSQTAKAYGASGIIGTIGNVANAAVGYFTDSFSGGGMISGDRSGLVQEFNPYIWVRQHKVSCGIEEVAPCFGRPLYDVRTLSTLSGYVQTTDASVNIWGWYNHANIINNLLNSGVFLDWH